MYPEKFKRYMDLLANLDVDAFLQAGAETRDKQIDNALEIIEMHDRQLTERESDFVIEMDDAFQKGNRITNAQFDWLIGIAERFE